MLRSRARQVVSTAIIRWPRTSPATSADAALHVARACAPSASSPWMSSMTTRFFCAGRDAAQEAINSHDVVVLSSPTCPFCAMAIDALHSQGVEHKAVPMTPEIKQGVIQRVGKGSVPSVWVKGTYIGGCNDGTEPGHGVIPMLKSGRL